MPRIKDVARIRVNVKGMEEVRALMKRAKGIAAPRLIQKYATLPAAMLVRDDAKRRVRRGPGIDTRGNRRKHLEEQIFATRGHSRDGSSIAGVDYIKAPHAHLVEFGTAPHIIRPRRRGRLLWIKKLRLLLPFVNHPGAEARPFLKPAARRTRPAVKKQLERGLRRLLFDVINRRTVDV
jgi:HK97 gp10 family phage protein